MWIIAEFKNYIIELKYKYLSNYNTFNFLILLNFAKCCIPCITFTATLFLFSLLQKFEMSAAIATEKTIQTIQDNTLKPPYIPFRICAISKLADFPTFFSTTTTNFHYSAVNMVGSIDRSIDHRIVVSGFFPFSIGIIVVFV